MSDDRNIPAVGCPKCGSSSWVLELDAPVPNHTKIQVLHCCGYDPLQDKRVLCDYAIRVNMVLEDCKYVGDREEVRNE